MNRTQKIVTLIIGVLILTSLIMTPRIDYFIRPKSEQELMRRRDVQAKSDRLFMVYIPCDVLIFGGLLIYTVRDKKK